VPSFDAGEAPRRSTSSIDGHSTLRMNAHIHRLSSGACCSLLRVSSVFLRSYYVLTFVSSHIEPTEDDLVAMLSIAMQEGRRLSFSNFGNSQRYTLIVSGPQSRRRRACHIHILVTASRWGKAWLYTILACKNALQAMRLRSDDRFDGSQGGLPRKSLEGGCD
jgi:hypothetical protein